MRQALTEYPTGQRGLEGTRSGGGSALLRMGTCSAHASRIVLVLRVRVRVRVRARARARARVRAGLG